ncbi:hypothetical protein CLV56_3577 [Mumia flava]|uniref:Uncharacterized protein n=1 Tax=Mumia flava TaxID=1348852 RepID=A0A2M9B7Y3_9ACTN|nr:hypothetical protein [Mumia flava]PJJ54073.1 hypothetical protein CLV56_3577 [Mumia flava]
MDEIMSAIAIAAIVVSIAIVTLWSAIEAAPRRVSTHRGFDTRTPRL